MLTDLGDLSVPTPQRPQTFFYDLQPRRLRRTLKPSTPPSDALSSTGGKFGASLWKMPEGAFEGDGQRLDLEECVRISTPSSTVWGMVWDPRLADMDEEDEPGDMHVSTL